MNGPPLRRFADAEEAWGEERELEARHKNPGAILGEGPAKGGL